MGKILRSLFGGGDKARAPSPVDTAAATDEAEALKANTKTRRVNLFKTAGGVSGQELEPDQITRRQTLLGN